MKMMRTVVLTISLLTAVVVPAQAQFDAVGSLDFPTSSSGDVEQHFLRGVAILHSFGWVQARDQFQEAQALDPDFAMAYWGESLAYNHPLVSQMNPDEPRAALQRLAPTKEEQIIIPFSLYMEPTMLLTDLWIISMWEIIPIAQV